MLNHDTLQAARYWKQQGRTSARALELARRDTADGRKRWPAASGGNIGGPWASGRDIMRFVENPAAVGLRPVGPTDSILEMRHTGWFADDWQDETLRGVVYQLPTGADGRPRFMYGWQSSNDETAAALVWEVVDDREDAARWADHAAERAAESEREYREASTARLSHDMAADEIVRLRRAALALLAEIRKARAAAGNDWPDICDALRETLQRRLDAIRAERKKRDELREHYGAHPGWQDI